MRFPFFISARPTKVLPLPEVASGELWIYGAALLATGVFGGLTAGLLGVGGGIVIVPVLYHVFTALGIDESVRMQLAVATSLSTIIPTSIRSVSAHRKREAVDMTVLRRWARPIVAGALLGIIAASALGGKGLTLIFAVLALGVAVYMAFGREEWRIADDLPGQGLQAAIAGVIGFLSTLMGIGGGSLGVPVLTLYNVPIHRAVGTSAGLGLLIAIPATLGFVISGWHVPFRPPLSLGYVSTIGFALIVPTTLLSVPWGAALAHRLSRTMLRRAFAVFLTATSIRMFIGYWS